VAILGIGIEGVRLSAPVRVVEVINEPATRGFSYRTLPGHPDSGEERFTVHIDGAGTVRGDIQAFSRPACWLSRLAGPIGRWAQKTP
jgi:uncharacterized protein (UPF0548 family)